MGKKKLKGMRGQKLSECSSQKHVATLKETIRKFERLQRVTTVENNQAWGPGDLEKNAKP